MDNDLTYLVYNLNGEFWDEILDSAYINGFTMKDFRAWRDYCAMMLMCGL